MKNFIRKIWDAVVRFICSVPYDKLLHFIAGVLIAAFFNITLGMGFCFWPVLFIAFGKEFFDKWTTGIWEWWDFGATCIGGAVIQLFVLFSLLG